MMSVTGTLGAWLPVLVLLGGSLGPAAGAAPASDQLRLQVSPDARTAIRLIGQLWDSGFFRRCPALRDEICDNDYVYFDPEGQLASLQKKGMACFFRGPEGKDTVYLREDIFDHYRVGVEGVFERRSVEEPALKVLVHELCHDFWVNILDGRERTLFAMDGAAFLDGYRQAMAVGEQRGFFLSAGWKGRRSVLAGLSSELDALIASYPPDLHCGAELFAWLGERAFSVGLMIPPAFCKYYSSLISTASPGQTGP